MKLSLIAPTYSDGLSTHTHRKAIAPPSGLAYTSLFATFSTNLFSFTIMTQYHFTLPSSSGEIFNSANHLPLVVYFYPKDNTPGCTTEGLDFNARLPEFQTLGYTVVGISRDSVKTHQNFCQKQGFGFELLSDADETVCKLFDVIKLKKLYGKEHLGIERSTFVLNSNGEITHEWRKVKVAGHAQAVLDTLKAEV